MVIVVDWCFTLQIDFSLDLVHSFPAQTSSESVHETVISLLVDTVFREFRRSYRECGTVLIVWKRVPLAQGGWTEGFRMFYSIVKLDRNATDVPP